MTRTGRPASGSTPLRRVEDRRIDGVRDDDRIAKLDPELGVLREAVARLEDRRVRELGVDRGDPRVRPVVEAAVRSDRTVDAVHQATVVAREAAKPREVEVERVEEARGSPARDAVALHREAAPLELRHEGAEELVTAAGGRRLELVEDREVGARLAASERQSTSVRTRRRTARPVRRSERGSARASTERHASLDDRCPHPLGTRARSSIVACRRARDSR